MFEYQLLETIPKDGTEIIGFYEKHGECKICFVQHRRHPFVRDAGDLGPGWVSTYLWLPIEEPQKWRPLNSHI